MAVKANVEELTDRIIATLRDETEDSWASEAIYDVILEAEKVIVNFRPDASATDHEFECQVGFKQDISVLTNPAPHALLDVKYNTDGSGAPGRSVRMVSRANKDAADPMWRTKTAATTIKEYMFDQREPMLFYTSPPAAAGAHLQISFSAIPEAYGTVSASTVTTVSSIYEPMLLEWALYRLFGHDVEGSVNISRSQQHLQNFQSQMGIKLSGEEIKGLINQERRS